MNDLLGQFPSIHVLGTRVHMVQMPEVLSAIENWIETKDRCRYVVATGMHGVMEAHRDQDFKAIVNSADLLVPDGISLVWVARRRGFPLKKRVSGPDLMWDFFNLFQRSDYSNFFYGDTRETLGQLTSRMTDAFPNLKIAGTFSPPFRQLTLEEDVESVRLINQSGADVVWVGLGLPKQERWMFDHRDKLEASVLVGVGAAFKFLSGQVRRAPAWAGDRGIEWAWRLAQEPRRMWRRVLIDGPLFVSRVALELSNLKKYD